METNARQDEPGTLVSLQISPESPRILKGVFDEFSAVGDDDYGFTKTHVPMKLAKFGTDPLISRSQAKRVLARFDQFSEVYLDFAGVDSIGHSFADEIFRVFARAHPQVKIVAVNTSEAIKRAIRATQSESPRPEAPQP